ncbi:hypothetical protein P9112_010824 [Eukaryota sp. TZLM1-RC]
MSSLDRQQFKLFENYALDSPRISKKVPLSLPQSARSTNQFIPFKRSIRKQSGSKTHRPNTSPNPHSHTYHNPNPTPYTTCTHYPSSDVHIPKLPLSSTHNPFHTSNFNSCCSNVLKSAFSELSAVFADVLHQQQALLDNHKTTASRSFLRALSDIEKKYIHTHDEMVGMYTKRLERAETERWGRSKTASRLSSSRETVRNAEFELPFLESHSNPIESVRVINKRPSTPTTEIKKKVSNQSTITTSIKPSINHISTQTDPAPTSQESSINSLLFPFIEVLRAALSVQEVLVVDLACSSCLRPPLSGSFVLSCSHVLCGNCKTKACASQPELTSIQCKYCGFSCPSDCILPCEAITLAVERLDCISDVGLLRNVIEDLYLKKEGLSYSLAKEVLQKTRPLSGRRY